MSRHLALLLALAATPAFGLSPAATKEERRAYVDGPWGQIHVRMAGLEQGPVVMLIHKMIWSSRVEPLLAARGIRTIAVAFGLRHPERSAELTLEGFRSLRARRWTTCLRNPSSTGPRSPMPRCWSRVGGWWTR